MTDIVTEAKSNIRNRLENDAQRLPVLIAAWRAEKLPLCRKEARYQLRRLIIGLRADLENLKRWETMG